MHSERMYLSYGLVRNNRQACLQNVIRKAFSAECICDHKATLRRLRNVVCDAATVR